MKICKKCEDVCKESENTCPVCGDELEVIEDPVEESTEVITESKDSKYKIIVKKYEESTPLKVVSGVIAVTALVGAAVYLINGRK